MKVQLSIIPDSFYAAFMIPRTLTPILKNLARHYPVVAITGPRHSGKTTLCRETFPNKPYINLQSSDLRRFAVSDARGFLAAYQVSSNTRLGKNT
jgi:predicted AAA+ superfamily ATPase